MVKHIKSSVPGTPCSYQQKPWVIGWWQRHAVPTEGGGRGACLYSVSILSFALFLILYSFFPHHVSLLSLFYLSLKYDTK